MFNGYVSCQVETQGLDPTSQLWPSSGSELQMPLCGQPIHISPHPPRDPTLPPVRNHLPRPPKAKLSNCSHSSLVWEDLPSQDAAHESSSDRPTLPAPPPCPSWAGNRKVQPLASPQHLPCLHPCPPPAWGLRRRDQGPGGVFPGPKRLSLSNTRPGEHVFVTQSCLTLCNPMACSPPGSSVHGIVQEEYWSGLPFPTPGGLPNPGKTWVTHIAGKFFTI